MIDPDGLDGLFGFRESDPEGAPTAAPLAARASQRMRVLRGLLVVFAVAGALFIAHRSFKQNGIARVEHAAAPPAVSPIVAQPGAGSRPPMVEKSPDPSGRSPQAWDEQPTVHSTSAIRPVNSEAGPREPPFIQPFRFNALALNDLTVAQREPLIAYARRCQGILRIVGHTCGVGADKVNRRVSLARARAVESLLRSEGVATAVRIESAGASQPAASNASESGRASNRRAEVYCETGPVLPVPQDPVDGQSRR